MRKISFESSLIAHANFYFILYTGAFQILYDNKEDLKFITVPDTIMIRLEINNVSSIAAAPVHDVYTIFQIAPGYLYM